MTFLLTNWRLLAVGILLLAVGIQTWRLDRCQSQFEEFRISTEALGRAQAAKNAAIIETNERIAREVVKGKDDAIVGLSRKYDRARSQISNYRSQLDNARRLRDNAGSGGVPAQPEAPALASACEPGDRLAERLGELEAALLDALERADREMIKYRALWEWAQGVR